MIIWKGMDYRNLRASHRKVVNKKQRWIDWKTHKSISPALLSLPVCDDNGLLDVSELLKILVQRLVRCVVRQSADKDLRECCVSRTVHWNSSDVWKMSKQTILIDFFKKYIRTKIENFLTSARLNDTKCSLEKIQF